MKNTKSNTHHKLMTFSTEMMVDIRETGRKLGMTNTGVIRIAIKEFIDKELEGIRESKKYNDEKREYLEYGEEKANEYLNNKNV